jgi:hypothetical protein
MPALDFPSSPTNGQIYEQYTYDSTKGAWRVTANPAATVVSSPTAPSSPVSGNLWLNTNDGVLFVYYNDGDTSQWVEVKSNTASGSTVAARVDALELADTTTNRAGLVPVIPTSVSVASGTATVLSDGAIQVTNATNISIFGCFSNTYKNYRFVMNTTNTVAGAPPALTYVRFITGTTVNTTNSYPYTVFYSQGTGYGNSAGSGANNLAVLGYARDFDGTIHTPFDSANATYVNGLGGYGQTIILSNFGFGAAQSFDGIQFFNNTFTGVFRFYGYR